MRNNVCIAAMAIVGFGKRLRLLLLPWLQPPLFLLNSPLFSHAQGWCMHLGLLILLWKERLLHPRLLAGCFREEQRSFSLIFYIYTPLKCEGVFGRLVTHVLILILFILRLVKSFIVSI